jgi:hypothetical protein
MISSRILVSERLAQRTLKVGGHAIEQFSEAEHRITYNKPFALPFMAHLGDMATLCRACFHRHFWGAFHIATSDCEPGRGRALLWHLSVVHFAQCPTAHHDNNADGARASIGLATDHCTHHVELLAGTQQWIGMGNIVYFYRSLRCWSPTTGAGCVGLDRARIDSCPGNTVLTSRLV